MPDVYNREGAVLGGTFASDAAQIAFASGGAAGSDPGLSGGVGLLSQNLQFSYVQQVTRLYEIGTNSTFLVAGRTQGSAGIGRILGPRPVQIEFYRNYGNVCNAANNNVAVTMAARCTGGAAVGAVGTGGTLAWLIKNLVLVSIAQSVAAQEMIVNEQLQAMYVALELVN